MIDKNFAKKYFENKNIKWTSHIDSDWESTVKKWSHDWKMAWLLFNSGSIYSTVEQDSKLNGHTVPKEECFFAIRKGGY